VTPWRATADGVELTVRLTPRGRRTGCEGVAEGPDGPALRVRVAAPPVDGAANAALVAFLADGLGIAKGDVAIVAGAKARTKTLRLRGAGLAARLAALARG
jgi:uncharacterized protein